MSGRRSPWDDRFHVGDSPVGKPLPSPEKFTARHGGPIRPMIDNKPPRSFHTTREQRNSFRRRQSRTPDSSLYAARSIYEERVSSSGGRSREGRKSMDRRSSGNKPRTPVRRPASFHAASARSPEVRESIAALAVRYQQRTRRHTSGDLLRRSIDKAVAKAVSKPNKKASMKGMRRAFEDKGPASSEMVSDAKAAAAGGGSQSLLKRSLLQRKGSSSSCSKGVPKVEMEEMWGSSPFDDSKDQNGFASPASEALSEVGLDDTLDSEGVGNLDLDLELDVEDGPLVLDLERLEAEEPAGYRLSESGAMNIEGFEIRRDGLAMTPGGATKPPTQATGALRDSLVSLGLLGRGASGTVYKALHVPSLRIVAIKDIPVFEQAQRQQMCRELSLLYGNAAPLEEDVMFLCRDAKGFCPQIIRFHDAFMSSRDATVSLVVEYMDGGSLQDIVDSGGCTSEGVLASVAQQVLLGLKHLHDKRQMHRDVKPSNLLINHRGEVKLCDFGLARDLDHTAELADTFVGTYPYMSPERIAGREYATASDIWALGLSVMALALGRFPYAEDYSGKAAHDYWGMLHALRDRPAPRLPDDMGFSDDFRDFLSQCLKKDPKLRATAAQLLKHRFLEGYGERAQEDDDDDAKGGETARNDLSEIAAVVQDYYDSLWVAQAKEGLDPTIPDLNPQRLRMLARQLGLPFEAVRRTFRTVVRDLRTTLMETYKL